MKVEISAIVIAIISLLVSIYVIFRDRKNKKLDNLLLARNRILDIYNDDKGIDILTIDESIDFFNENPDSEDAQRYKAISKKHTFKVDREFEFACYLVINKQIDLIQFFSLFKGWLAGREWIWNTTSKHKKNNLPYTWQVISLCKKKKLLPLNKTSKET